MASPLANMRIMPSVFDRLTDQESMGTASSPGYAEKEMLRAVRADVEQLLNTRQTVSEVPEQFAESNDSILTYGLPDMVTYSGTSAQQYMELATEITKIIHRFEPRLKNVKVQVTPSKDNDPRNVRFHIDASLNVENAPAVGFLTVVELTTGRAFVSLDRDQK